MRYSRHTLDILTPLVAQSFSYAEVLRGLGLKQTGGSQSNIKRRIVKFGLDTSHFMGMGRNRGSDHRGGPEKKTPAQIFVLRDPLARPEAPHRLKRAMIEMGTPYRCEMCALSGLWNGKLLDLQIDHKNGQKHDNRRENLRFLCPNCHTQTETFGSKNAHFHKVEWKCSSCDTTLNRKSTSGYCMPCERKERRGKKYKRQGAPVEKQQTRPLEGRMPEQGV